MQKVRFVGLDVHVWSITIAVAEEDRSLPPENLATIPNDTALLLKKLQKLGPLSHLRCCYEAGPTGFGLCRDLRAAGVDCMVVAPSLVPVQVGNRIKTDRRDAVKLARFLRSGDLTPVYVPDEATEAIRDLERARDAAKKAERAARQQLLSFLYRHGRRFDGKSVWTLSHLDWVRRQRFAHEAQQRVLEDYLKAVVDASERVRHLTQDITQLVENWSLAPLVKALQSLRGVQLITAVVIAAELGDLSRFSTATELMSFLGLVPSEHSSGESRRQGRITRTGNTHVRRILVESAWAYRHRPAIGENLRRRSKDVAPEVKKIAWKAQHRLHGRFAKLCGRGKTKQQVVVAVARELAGFVWSISRQPQLLAS